MKKFLMNFKVCIFKKQKRQICINKKKRFAIFLFFILGFSLVFGQSDIKSMQIRKNSFIEISKETLILFLNQTMEEWIDLMVKNGYEEMDTSDGIVIYSKGKIGEQIQAIAKNELGVISIDWYDYEDKKRITQKFESEIKDLYFKKKENISYYTYYEYIIGLELQEDTDFVFERVLIKRAM